MYRRYLPFPIASYEQELEEMYTCFGNVFRLMQFPVALIQKIATRKSACKSLTSRLYIFRKIMSTSGGNKLKSNGKSDQTFVKPKVPLIIQFFYSKIFLINLVLAGIVVFLIYWLTVGRLDSYTAHGERITVPNFIGEHMDGLDAFCEEHQLTYHINDSIYSLDAPKGTVISQDPLEGDQVKEGRTIYVTVVSMQDELKSMPQVVDKTSRQATAILNSIGLRVEEFIPQPSDICDGCVLKQLYNGEPIEAGEFVPRGSGITLVVGKMTSSRNPIPDLRGLTISEAKVRLSEQSLNLGVEIYQNCATAQDSANAKVYKQSPAFSRLGTIELGGQIDLYLELATEPAAAAPNSGTNE